MGKTLRDRLRPSSFTLIELLVVMGIIAILAGLTLAAYSGVAKSAARSRAKSEIQAYSTALESYKIDNGAYPTPTKTTFTQTNDYTTAQASTANGPYQNSSAFLYQSFTGQTYWSATPVYTAGVKIYATFTRSQLGNNDAADMANPIYLKDPFGNSYGYFPGNGAAAPPNNGTGSFDLWSTAGDTTGNTATWVTDWAN